MMPQVNVIILPLDTMQLMLPSVFVADVVRHEPSIAGRDLGKIFWRGIEIPMIFLQPVARKYAVVLRGTEIQGKHRFYGLALGMLPKIIWVEGRQLSLVSEDRKESWIMAEVKVGLEYYLLPDVSMIEKMLLTC